MTGLTERQAECLRFVKKFTADHGYAPALHELAAILGVTSTSWVKNHLCALERKGFLLRAPGRSRAISLRSGLLLDPRVCPTCSARFFSGTCPECPRIPRLGAKFFVTPIESTLDWSDGRPRNAEALP